MAIVSTVKDVAHDYMTQMINEMDGDDEYYGDEVINEHHHEYDSSEEDV
jgi:hypothetical protein